MAFNLDEYVDVAERIRIAKAEFEHLSLQSEITFVEGGVLCKAYAYRYHDDERPGIGHAFEPIPGKTPYTRDSEVMNAETSAWGRAIVALGFETKKIASREEVRNRVGPVDSEAPVMPPPAHGANTPKPTDTITTQQLNQAVSFAKEHGTDWATEVGVALGDVDPATVTVEQAKKVFENILANAAKHETRVA